MTERTENRESGNGDELVNDWKTLSQLAQRVAVKSIERLEADQPGAKNAVGDAAARGYGLRITLDLTPTPKGRISLVGFDQDGAEKTETLGEFAFGDRRAN